MTGYIIRNTETGKYVARAGGVSSYTPLLQRAMVYATREEADRDRCPDNERVLSIEEAMKG